MHILDEIKADSSGRISITKLFDEVPREVLVLFDTEEKALFFWESKGDWPKVQRKVDSKGRVALPEWFKKLGDEFYLVPESKEKHCLLVKKLFDEV